MDYQTKPISRNDLRTIAKWFRHLFQSRNIYRFDVLWAFEKIHEVLSEITTEVIEDNDLSVITDPDVPSACIPDLKGNYHIIVRQKVYDGAARGVGGYRDHITHEMAHAVLCLLGFTPVFERTFENNELKPWISMEWQAKALAGEILIPYENTKGMSSKMIRFLCQVSKDCADKRTRLDPPYKKEVPT